MIPEVKFVGNDDFDGYFTYLVSRIVDKKVATGLPFRSKHINVSAGPWRSYDVSWSFDEGTETFSFDFYSVCRHHGGPGLTEDERNTIIGLM